MKILLGITGSVASVLTEKLVDSLLKDGHEVKVVITKASEYFLKANDTFSYFEKNGIEVASEADEWPEESYHKHQPIPHIDLGNWADILLIAPITKNTLAKIANGISDNLLTCVVSAWPDEKPIILAPAMNTKMWGRVSTQSHISIMQKDFKVKLVNPVAKKLACGDEGLGAMADIQDIVKVVSTTMLEKMWNII